MACNYAPMAYFSLQKIPKIKYIKMSIKHVIVVESASFSRQSHDVWDNEERLSFINYIACNPLAGDEIKGTGGVRKVRWSGKGHGKRGGVRVIYYYHDHENPIFLLTLYSKNQKANLNEQDKELIRKQISVLKSHIRNKRKG
jgi:hypothetical protein